MNIAVYSLAKCWPTFRPNQLGQLNAAILGSLTYYTCVCDSSTPLHSFRKQSSITVLWFVQYLLYNDDRFSLWHCLRILLLIKIYINWSAEDEVIAFGETPQRFRSSLNRYCLVKSLEAQVGKQLLGKLNLFRIPNLLYNMQ